ncbi:Uncharacterised protein [uncultured archaeon]|nr:Uncharacterised protein [uncultured archaeon]
MRRVTVVLTGQDNSKHEYSCEAASLFDAARQATRSAWQFWWFDPRRIIEVWSGSGRWLVETRLDCGVGDKKTSH